MTLKIGETIKRLRKDQDITQDKLAAYLNISYQAVSKWENGTALPDISLIPKLANFFGVTADELLGIKPEENNAELMKYEEEYLELGRKGKVLEKIEISRKVLDLYPRNFQWMLNLASSLTTYNATKERQKYSKEHKFIEEAIELCEKILEDCTVDSIRHSAIQILCYRYPDIGKQEEAVKLAESMPNMYLCREDLLSRIYTGEERLKQNQKNLIQMIDHCASILYEMACREDLQQAFSVEVRNKFLETALTLYQTILDGDENCILYNGKAALFNLARAKLYCQANEPYTAIKHLLLSEKYAKIHDSVADLGEQKYNSPFLSHITWDTKYIITNWDKTLQEDLLCALEDGCFNSLRENAEFLNLQKRLRNARSKR